MPSETDKPFLHDLVRARFDALPRRQRNAILDLPTLDDAVVAVIARIHGATAHASVYRRDDYPSMVNLLVAYNLDSVEDWTQRRFRDFTPDGLDLTGRFVTIEAGHVTLSEWERVAYATRGLRTLGRKRRTIRAVRRNLLDSALGTATQGNYTVEDHLRYSLHADKYFQGIALPLWWEARLAEGYTPDAAWMMLGLTIDPHLLAPLVFRGERSPITHPHHRAHFQLV